MKRASAIFTLLLIFTMSAFAATADASPQPLDQYANMALAVVGIATGGFVLRAAGVTLRHGILASTVITTTLLNAAYGNEYKDNSKSQKDLMQGLYHTAEFDKLFKTVYTDLTVWEKGLSRSTSIIQPAQTEWTPTGEIEFTPSVIPLDPIKADLEFSSFDIEEGFAGFLHENNVPQTGQALTKYIMNEHVIPQFVEDMELHLAFNGVKVAPSPGVAGAVGTSINGIYTTINAGITAGTMVPIAVGAMPTDPEQVVAYFEAWAEQIHYADRMKPMNVAVSVNTCSLFERGMLLKYNQNYNQATDRRKIMRHENLTLVPQIAMGNSTKIFCTPAGNAFRPINVGKGALWLFETRDRVVKAWTNQRVGYGFWNQKRVYTNDVELTPQS